MSRVRERLGYEPFSMEATSTIEVSIARTADELIAEVVVRAKDGAGRSSRTIRSQALDCSALSDALVLAIAMIVDPDAVFGVPATKPAPPSPSTIKPQPPPPQYRQRRPTEPLQSRTTLRPVVVLGLAPRAAPGVELAVHGALAKSLAFEAGALWVSETSSAGSTYHFGTTLGFVGGCSTTRLGRRVAVDTCAELWAGATHAFVTDRSPRAPGQRFLSAASATSSVVFDAIGPVVLEAGLHGLVLFGPYEFRAVNRAEPIFVQPPVSLVLFGGAGLAF